MKHQPLTPEQSQLTLEIYSGDVAAATQGGHISLGEALLISRAAEQALEDGSAFDPDAKSGEPPAWLRDYRELREAGWPWRVACYIAWSASPRANRWPTTQQSLAQDVLGLRSDRVIRSWLAKNPTIEAAVGMLQAKALFEHRRDVLNALITSASTPNHLNHPDRKLYLEMTGDYTPRVEVDQRKKVGQDDLSQMSDAELADAERAVAEMQKARNPRAEPGANPRAGAEEGEA